MKSRF